MAADQKLDLIAYQIIRTKVLVVGFFSTCTCLSDAGWSQCMDESIPRTVCTYGVPVPLVNPLNTFWYHTSTTAVGTRPGLFLAQKLISGKRESVS